MTDKIWYKVARKFMKAGKLPIPIGDKVIEICKSLLTEEQAKFMQVFKKRAMNFEEINANLRPGMDEESIREILKSLMYVGAISGIPSRTTGAMVYRVTPFVPGIVELELMRGIFGEKQEHLAKLHEEFFNELVEGTQKNYDQMVSLFKDSPPIGRTIPVEEKMEIPQEVVVPFEEVSKIVESTDVVSVGTCYCRHSKDLTKDPCKLTRERKNCFSFGRTATFLISQGFAEEVSKEEAIKIMKQCEEEGLIHKAVHEALNPNREIISICNCCKCCCGIIGMYHRGAAPLRDLASHIAKVNDEECVGCGTCVDKCNIEAIELIDDIAVVDEAKCVGCGVCAYHCPSDAMELIRTGPRNIFVPPPKLEGY